MTTFNGHSSHFGSGKMNPNREPTTSVVVIEKQYRVHREKLQEIQPLVDDRVVIPSFFKTKNWKKHQIKVHDEGIALINESIYKRLTKVESQGSIVAADSKEHVRHVNQQIKYWKSINDYGRQKKLLKIQKENETLMKRIEKTKPSYTLKDCQDWYKHHIRFKQSRRVDPTAGHLLRGVNDILPPPLPPIKQKIESVDSISRITGLNAPSTISTIKTASALEPRESDSPSLLTAILEPISVLSQNFTQMTQKRSSTLNALHDRSKARIGRAGWTSGATSKSTNPYKSSKYLRYDNYDEESVSDTSLARSKGDSRRTSFVPFQNFDSAVKGSLFDADHKHSSQEQEKQRKESISPLDNDSLDELIVLDSRPFVVLFDKRNCIVQVCATKQCLDVLLIRVLSTSNPPKIYSERALQLESVEQILENSATITSMIHQVTNHEDIQILRQLLINMFHEADNKGQGYLTFDKFQQLMEKINFGISSQELRFVISEADENENGVIDYDEFIPLAIDLIQSFHARIKAKTIFLQEDILVDDQILTKLASNDIKIITNQCLEKIHLIDTKRYGVIRPSELKKCLLTISSINEIEINMLCQLLPRDGFGRCHYESIEQVLTHVRYLSLKHAIIESHGSEIRKYLLDICKEEEFKLYQQENNSNSNGNELNSPNGGVSKVLPLLPSGSDFIGLKGLLPVRNLINILYNAPRLTLSRLQVLVIMAEALVIDDGMINYYQFIPIVAKTIELMFEPITLRQRAELIENTSYSSDNLLSHGTNNPLFEQKLKTLFKSFDIDHNGYIDENEFIACIGSLDYQLTKGEIMNLMNKSLNTKNCFKFNEFFTFFKNNLIQLEKEKHIRILYMKIHRTMNNYSSSQHQRGSTAGGGYNIDNIGSASSPKNNTQSQGFYRTSTPLESINENGANRVSSPSNNDNMVSSPANKNQNNPNSTELMFQTIASSLLTQPIRPMTISENIRNPKRMNSNQYHSIDYDSNSTVDGLLPHIAMIFKIIDQNGSGYVLISDILDLLKHLDIKLSISELNMLLVDIQGDTSNTSNSLIDYKAFIPILAEFLETYHAYMIATELRNDKEKWANNKANKIIHSTMNEIQNIAKYIKDRLLLVIETVHDSTIRISNLHEILKNSNSGLNKIEANMMMTRLVNQSTTANQISSNPVSRNGNQGRMSVSNVNYDLNGSSIHTNDLSRRNSIRNSVSSVGESNLSNNNSHNIANKRLSRQYSAVVTVIPSIESNQGLSTLTVSTPVLTPRHDSLLTGNLRSDITVNEIIDIIVDIRKQLIIKNLLDDYYPNEMRNKLLKLLTKESKQLKQLNLLDENSIYLPTQICYQCLENLQIIKIHRAKIIAIMSWTKCYDSTGQYIDYHKFAYHASDILTRLNDKQFMELYYNQSNKSLIPHHISHGDHSSNHNDRRMDRRSSDAPERLNNINDTILFNHLKENDILTYFTTSFNKLETNDHTIHLEDMKQILKHFPQLHLTDQDIQCFLSLIPSSMIMDRRMSQTNQGLGNNTNSNKYLSSRNRSRGSLSSSGSQRNRNTYSSQTNRSSRINTPNILSIDENRRNHSIDKSADSMDSSTHSLDSFQTNDPNSSKLTYHPTIYNTIKAAISATAAVKNKDIRITVLNDNHCILWKELLSQCYTILKQVLTERNNEHEHQSHYSSLFLPESINSSKENNSHISHNHETILTLKKLSNRLIDVLNVKNMNGNIVITLPEETSTNHSSILNIPKSNPNRSIPSLNILNGYNNYYNDETMTEIVKISAIIPILSQTFIQKEQVTANLTSSLSTSSSSLYHIIKTYLPNLLKLAVHIRILAINQPLQDDNNDSYDQEYEDDFITSNSSKSLSHPSYVRDTNDSKQIIVNVLSTDNKYGKSIFFPSIRIPSIAQVDRELAIEFAKNLTDTLYFEYKGNEIDLDEFDDTTELQLDLLEVKMNEDINLFG